LFLGKKMVAKKNLLRWSFLVGIVGAHLLWRHAYYGAWVPNTFVAKTGNRAGQWEAGCAYVLDYVRNGGSLIFATPIGLIYGIAKRSLRVISLFLLTLAFVAYVASVGGDWMPCFRFLAPIEPFWALLADAAIRFLLEKRGRLVRGVGSVCLLALLLQRSHVTTQTQRTVLRREEQFWTMAAGGTARWLKENTEPGEIAMGDIGEIGWVTDYPVLDLLGLVDPVIARLPGGYTQKLGPGFLDRFFEKKPRYALVISDQGDCVHPSVLGSKVLFYNPWFQRQYALAGSVPLDGGYRWCIYERREPPPSAVSPAARP
jgi:hypothetical protein